MAAKLNAAGTTTYFTRDASAAAISTVGSAWSMCGWIYLDTNTGSVEEVAAIGTDPASNARIGFRIGTSDNIIEIVKDGDSDYNLGAVSALGVWTFVAYSTPSIFAGDGYYGTTTTVTHNGSAPVNFSSTLDFVMVGRLTGASQDFFKGRIAHLRIWQAVLSQAEFEAEMVSATAVRATNLWGAYEFAADGNDSSGHGYNLTQNGTDLSYVAGPISAAVIVPQINASAIRASVAAVHSSHW